MRGWVVVLAIASNGRSVLADGEKGGMADIPARSGKLGAEAAIGSATGRGGSVMLGAAATYVHVMPDLAWYGIQADVLADWDGSSTFSPRWTVGPEFGFAILGGDISYYGQVLDKTVENGVALRLKLTVGFAAIYLRYGYLPRAEHHSVDFGAQLKFPFFESEEKVSF